MGVEEKMVNVVFGPLNFSYGFLVHTYIGTLTDTYKHTDPQIELKQTSLLIQGAFMTGLNTKFVIEYV